MNETRVVPVEFLPCPFCALNPELRTDGCGDYYVSCVDGDCAGSAQPDGETGDVARSSRNRIVAISAWNKRAAPPTADAQGDDAGDGARWRKLMALSDIPAFGLFIYRFYAPGDGRKNRAFDEAGLIELIESDEADEYMPASLAHAQAQGVEGE